MRQVGLHIRFLGSFSDVAQHAVSLKLPFFQCFLVLKSTGNLAPYSDEDIQQFLALRRAHFQDLYVHGSYWINLSGVHNNGHRALMRELSLAQKLEFTHFIMHPGSAKGAGNKYVGIDALARALNALLRKDLPLKIVLENTAHGGLSVGGDIRDFALLLDKLEQPEKILFCIDTAHAYSYGYDMRNDEQREAFIKLLDSAIGIEKIALIHLNDINEECGSKIDKHEMIGMGRIGQHALQAFCLHEKLKHIPVLMELPVVSCEQEKEMLLTVRAWHE